MPRSRVSAMRRGARDGCAPEAAALGALLFLASFSGAEARTTELNASGMAFMLAVITILLVIGTIGYVVFAVQQLKLRQRYTSMLIHTLQTKPPKPCLMFVGPARFDPVRSELESQPWRRPGHVLLNEDSGFDQETFRLWNLQRQMARAQHISSSFAAMALRTGAGFFKDQRHDVLLHSTRLDRPQLIKLYTEFVVLSVDGEVENPVFKGIIERLAKLAHTDAKEYTDLVFEAFAAPGANTISCDEYIAFMALSGDTSAEDRLKTIFDVYGEDNNGSFAADEIEELCLTLLALRRLCRDQLWSKPDEEIVATMLERMGFTDGKRNVDSVTFVESCVKDDQMNSLLDALSAFSAFVGDVGDSDVFMAPPPVPSRRLSRRRSESEDLLEVRRRANSIKAKKEGSPAKRRSYNFEVAQEVEKDETDEPQEGTNKAQDEFKKVNANLSDRLAVFGGDGGGGDGSDGGGDTAAADALRRRQSLHSRPSIKKWQPSVDVNSRASGYADGSGVFDGSGGAAPAGDNASLASEKEFGIGADASPERTVVNPVFGDGAVSMDPIAEDGDGEPGRAVKAATLLQEAQNNSPVPVVAAQARQPSIHFAEKVSTSASGGSAKASDMDAIMNEFLADVPAADAPAANQAELDRLTLELLAEDGDDDAGPAPEPAAIPATQLAQLPPLAEEGEDDAGGDEMDEFEKMALGLESHATASAGGFADY